MKITIDLEDLPSERERKRLVLKPGKKWRVMSGPGGHYVNFGPTKIGSFDLKDASGAVVIWVEEDPS